VVFWEAGHAVLYNYATGMRAHGSIPVWQILDFCQTPRSVSDVVGAFGAGTDARQIERLLDALESATFLSGSRNTADRREEAMEKWSAWNPSAGFFHAVSRQCVVGEQAWFDRRLRAKAAERPMPESIKPPARSRVSLPHTSAPAPIRPAVTERRTYRQFGKAPIALTQLAELLELTSGITHWLTLPGLGEVPLKGSPSGGARHPIETYVVAAAVEGLPQGTYRYAADRHELDIVSPRTSRATLRGFLPRQPWFAECAAVLFFTAVFERTAWRYEYPRAYRAVLLEAGHVCQTFLLAATSMELAPFCTMAMDDERVERHLGIDGIAEAVLYTAGVGARPDVEARAVPPPGGAPARVRRNARL
jgi:SagB-type dehydrogenase family enzyme